MRNLSHIGSAFLVATLGCTRSPAPLPDAPSPLAQAPVAPQPAPPPPHLPTAPPRLPPAPKAAATPQAPAPPPHAEASHFHPAARSDGTVRGDLTIAEDRWSRIAGLLQAALSAEATAIAVDQVGLWQTEVTLYSQRIAGLQADLAALETARPVLVARAIERRLAEAGTLHQVVAETELQVQAGRAELLELLAGYEASRDDRKALLALVAALPPGSAQVRATAAHARWQAVRKDLDSLK